MRILLDVTRSFIHMNNATPTGIDRVESAYIRYFLNKFSSCDLWFIITTPAGKAALKPYEMRRYLEHIDTRQAVRDPYKPTLIELRTSLLAADANKPTHPRRILGSRIKDNKNKSKGTIASLLFRSAGRFSRLMKDKSPSIYIHTSHIQLDQERYYRWLHFSHVKSVFFVHDLIPIEYPEFCGAGAAMKHRNRMATVARYADVVIVNSEHTKSSLVSHFLAEEAALPPVVISPLASLPSSGPARNFENFFQGCPPFFLHVGTIEGRKNIGHLLNTWRELIAGFGAREAPRLLLIGKRGWECETVLGILDRSKELAPYIIEISDLQDSDLAVLMQEAAGLITVSMAEGYGLPPLEAIWHKLPVIASDIPAHKEILGDNAVFVTPCDGRGLISGIMDIIEKRHPIHIPDNNRLQMITWDEHVRNALGQIEQILGPLAG